MSFLLTLLLFLVLFASMALLYNEGMWSNAVRLVNVVTAGLVAMNFFEPLARALEGMNSTFTYFWDFISLWGIFAVTMVVFRYLTGFASRVKVRFLKIADQIGSVVFALWVGWVLVAFTLTTFHTAPLARNFMFGGFRPGEKMFLGMAPDQQWLGFTQQVSKGSFSRGVVFDPNGRFIANYAERRSGLQKQAEANGTFRVQSGSTPKR
ncbi:MAG: CvpA family protein [Pirellulales bacterium]|nr:CvpA family protein [Pirellulales bacterium]